MVLVELIKQWIRDYPDDELLLAVPTARRGRGAADLPAGIEILRTHLRVHPVINAIELPILAKRRTVDAILAFNFAAVSNRGVVFMHDAMYQSNPEWFTPLERAYFSLEPLLARRARSVIATSGTERKRIAAFNPRLRRLVECGLSISTSLESAIPKDPGLGLAEDSFILCVGRLNVRKNLENTMRAMDRSGLLSQNFPLVVIGEPSGRVSQTDEFANAIEAKKIITADRLEESELKWLYMNCRVFACLSLDEGFGLPAVEAATFGAPVLVSDISVFRETLGSYGVFVDPADTEAIAACTRRMVTTRSQARQSYAAPHNWGSVCSRIRNELQRLSGRC
jgi:glycosyltransferase involved in cell wall biosynthesis